MKQVHKYVLRRLLRDECGRFIGRYGKNPLSGLKRVLVVNKIDYTESDTNEIIVCVGEKKLVIRQED